MQLYFICSFDYEKFPNNRSGKFNTKKLCVYTWYSTILGVARATKKHYVAKQLLINGTAFGEIIQDIRYAENKKEYFQKTNEAIKHAQKTKYWLQLCKYSELFPNPDNLLNEIEELFEQVSETSFLKQINNQIN